MNTPRLLLALCTASVLTFAAHAQSSFADLAKSATASAAGGEFKLPADIVGSLKGLASSFNLSQLNYASLAKDALSALNVGQDSKALAALDKIGAAKLTDSQLSALKAARVAVDAYVLKRNFSGIPAVQSVISDSVALIKNGDFAGVAAKLQGMAASVKPTAEQKAVLGSLIAHYQSWSVRK